MPLTKETVQTKITVVEDGTLAIREVTRVKDGDTVIAESKPNTRTVSADDNINDLEGLALEVASKVFTPQRKAKAAEKRAERIARQNERRGNS